MPRLSTTVLALCLVTQGYAAEQPLDAHWQAGESRDRHQAITEGAVAIRDVQSTLGLLEGRTPAAVLDGPGSTLAIDLDLGAHLPADVSIPVLLEIQELHQAQRQAFAYAVEVDGVRVCVRTFAELLAAPMSWFASIDRSLIRDPRRLRVTFINLGRTPVAIANVWGHADFYHQAREQGLEAPLRVLTYVDKIEKAADSTKVSPPAENFTRGAMYGSSYLHKTAADEVAGIGQILDAASSSSQPFAVMWSRWWGHTSLGPDGLGGYLGDIRHNQLVYDRAEDRLRLTTPNKWGNTPWQSLNSADSLALTQRKLRGSLRLFADRYALMRARNTLLAAPDLVMEWGVSYWEDGADFSAAVVAAAGRDGVALDPRNGLDDREIAWMQKNIAVYNDHLAQTYREALGSDAVVVRDGKVTPPTQHLFDHVFTHTLEAQLFPSYDDRLPGWVGGVGPRMWPSSEMYQFADPRHHLYALSSGRLACANLEMTMLMHDEFAAYLRRGFANGMEFLAMFNPQRAPLDVDAQVALAEHLRDLPCPEAPDYLDPLLDVDLLRDGRPDFLSNPPSGITTAGLTLVLPNPETAMSDGFVRPSDPQLPGELTCRLSDPQKFATGLRLRLEGRVTTGSIAILAGTDPDHLQPVRQFTMGTKLSWFNLHAAELIDLDAVARGASEVYVRLVLTGGKGDTSIRAIQAYRPWAQATGRLRGRPDTYGERRLQNTWIQQRAVGARLRTAYLAKAGAQAGAKAGAKAGTADAICQRYDALVEDDRLAEGIRLLAAEIAEVLPARFALVGQGPLGRLPLELQLPTATEAVVVTVLAHSETTTRLAVFGESATTLRLRWRGGERIAERVVQESTGLWTVTWRAGQDADGWTTLAIPSPAVASPLPRSTTFRGRLDQLTAQQVAVEVQDPTLGDFTGSRLTLALAGACTFQRGDNATTAKPQVDDLAEITVDAHGQATAIRLRTGVVRGRIAAFTPAPLRELNPHNGRITLDDGEVFELSYNKDHTRLMLDELTGLAIAHDIAKVEHALRPGLRVEVTYTPDFPAGIPPRIRSLRQLAPGE
jgi:hypothetical protein